MGWRSMSESDGKRWEMQEKKKCRVQSFDNRFFVKTALFLLFQPPPLFSCIMHAFSIGVTCRPCSKNMDLERCILPSPPPLSLIQLSLSLFGAQITANKVFQTPTPAPSTHIRLFVPFFLRPKSQRSTRQKKELLLLFFFFFAPPKFQPTLYNNKEQ